MKKLARSQKKFIRRQKAQIRAKFLDIKKQKEEISALYKQFLDGKVVEFENNSKKTGEKPVPKPKQKSKSKK